MGVATHPPPSSPILPPLPPSQCRLCLGLCLGVCLGLCLGVCLGLCQKVRSRRTAEQGDRDVCLWLAGGGGQDAAKRATGGYMSPRGALRSAAAVSNQPPNQPPNKNERSARSNS
jgi:hypothetical protein